MSEETQVIDLRWSNEKVNVTIRTDYGNLILSGGSGMFPTISHEKENSYLELRDIGKRQFSFTFSRIARNEAEIAEIESECN